MKISKAAILTGLLLCFAITNAQTTLPECVYQSTDFDGDGFGYENNTSCRITENSIGDLPSGNTCVDDDGDGWGWDGTSSCATPAQAPVCVDTAPLGDGWGWDGVSSCVVTDNGFQPQAPVFNELDEIQKHFIDVDVPGSIITRAAVAICPGSTFSPYYFLFTGSMSGNGRAGMWSTGVSTSDTRLRLAFANSVSNGVFYLPFRISENGVWEGDSETIENQCQWMQP